MYEQYPETYIRLLRLINDFAEKSTSNRLPTEVCLAEQMGLSRIKIRDVLSQLEAAGYIIRKRGVGTLLNRRVLQQKARLDIDTIYVDMVRDCGHEARATLNKLKRIREPETQIAEKLQLKLGEAVYLFEKEIFADEKPVILIADYIPARYYDDVESDLSLMDTNIFHFIQQMCDELLETILVHVDACTADDYLSSAMQVPVGFPLMKLDSVCYTQTSEAVLYSTEFCNTKTLPFSFQKRILSGKFKRSSPPSQFV